MSNPLQESYTVPLQYVSSAIFFCWKGIENTIFLTHVYGKFLSLFFREYSSCWKSHGVSKNKSTATLKRKSLSSWNCITQRLQKRSCFFFSCWNLDRSHYWCSPSRASRYLRSIRCGMTLCLQSITQSPLINIDFSRLYIIPTKKALYLYLFKIWRLIITHCFSLFYYFISLFILIFLISFCVFISDYL
jgi:hypothetical protein